MSTLVQYCILHSVQYDVRYEETRFRLAFQEFPPHPNPLSRKQNGSMLCGGLKIDGRKTSLLFLHVYTQYQNSHCRVQYTYIYIIFDQNYIHIYMILIQIYATHQLFESVGKIVRRSLKLSALDFHREEYHADFMRNKIIGSGSSFYLWNCFTEKHNDEPLLFCGCWYIVTCELRLRLFLNLLPLYIQKKKKENRKQLKTFF